MVNEIEHNMCFKEATKFVLGVNKSSKMDAVKVQILETTKWLCGCLDESKSTIVSKRTAENKPKQPSQQQDSDKNEADGQYIGRTFKKQGKKKDGTDWKYYKVQILVGEKEWNFWTFDSAKGFEDLEDGIDVKVLYNTEQMTREGKEITLKKAYMFIPRTEDTKITEESEYISDDLE